MDRFLIDERLSADLVATAKARGYDTDYLPHIGKAGWQDWNLVPYAGANDYIVVTLNRRDFLKQHAAIEVHPGLVILIPQAPENRGQHQAALFEKALDAYAAMNDDLVNKVMEVRADGSVHVREWNAARAPPNHRTSTEFRAVRRNVDRIERRRPANEKAVEFGTAERHVRDQLGNKDFADQRAVDVMAMDALCGAGPDAAIAIDAKTVEQAPRWDWAKTSPPDSLVPSSPTVNRRMWRGPLSWCVAPVSAT